MKLHPFYECVKKGTQYIEAGATLYQQFNCANCGTKQTMDVPNTFYQHGICDKCGHDTNIETDGCNYMLYLGRNP